MHLRGGFPKNCNTVPYNHCSLEVFTFVQTTKFYTHRLEWLCSIIFKLFTLSMTIIWYFDWSTTLFVAKQTTEGSLASLLVSHFRQKTLIGRTTWWIRQHIPQPGWTTKRDDDHRWQSTTTKDEQKMTLGQRREMEQVVVEQVSPALSGLCSHQNMDAVWSSQWGMKKRLQWRICACYVFAFFFSLFLVIHIL